MGTLGAGVEPDAGDGRVLITLSESSAEVLTKVDGIKRWRVQPTMVRGSRSTQGVPVPRVGVSQRLKGRSRKTKAKSAKAKKNAQAGPKSKHGKVTGTGKGIMQKGTKKTVHKGAAIPEVKAPGDITVDDIRRSDDGREAIKLLVQELYEIDMEKNPASPVFDAAGHCRMKFEGASDYTWQCLLDAAPQAMESLLLVSKIGGVFQRFTICSDIAACFL